MGTLRKAKANKRRKKKRKVPSLPFGVIDTASVAKEVAKEMIKKRTTVH